MYTELNIDIVLRQCERQRNEHMEEARRLRALNTIEGSAAGTLTGSWRVANGLLHLRWNWSGLLRRVGEPRVAEAA